ncbi:AAA family ATPase [Massilia sp. PWRC2]|uniref:ExeA family protein n=1 Tax=Massilia sp. PWRC2 TaxID=2804626 RepID=UPI003CF4AB13
MYTQFFNLRQPPFSIAPDPRYLFMSERHREALAHLLYGVGSGGGFVLLTGEIGAGKTTVCRCFIEQIPANCRLAYIFNPKLSVEELLLSICDEFGIALAPAGAGAVSVKVYVDAINAYLLDSHAQGLNNVLVIDEAQNLSADVLEQLRLLTNLETSERKLLQIILIGQPELRTMLARPELEQLAQRVIARYHLGSLSALETRSYVAHRLAVAGAGAGNPFSARVTALVHALTGGVPRRINLLCDRALLGAYVENVAQVSRPILRRAAAEVFGAGAGAPTGRRWPLAAAALLACAVAAAAGWQIALQTAPAPRPLAQAPVNMPMPAPMPAPRTLAAPTVPSKVEPISAYGSVDDALPELALLWHATLGADAPCQAALKDNLHCYQGKGGLYELRLLDRPAILSLHEGAQVGYVVLVKLTETTATVRMKGVTRELSVAAVAARFDGQYTTLWAAPRAFRDQFGVSDSGADVDWIGARLAELNDLKAPPLGQAFDSRTRAQLRKFQGQQNLKADGVAGPRTYMRLNQLSGVIEPRLLAMTPRGR